MKRIDRFLHTDSILLAGLLLGVIKAASGPATVLPIPEWLDSLMSLAMCLCYGLHVLLQKPGRKRLLAYGAAAGIGAYSSLRSGDMSGMITLLTCITLADCDFERVMKKLFQWNLALFFIKAALSLGLALLYGPEGPLTHEYINNVSGYLDVDFAVHLGFGHKNTLAMYMVSIFLMWVWVYYPKLQIKHLLPVIAGCTVLLFLDQCKTACLIFLFIGLLFVFFRWRKQDYSLPVQMIAAIAPTAMFLLSLGLTYLYRCHPSSITHLFNRVLTGRLHICAVAWDQYGPSFFGNLASHINQIENRMAYIDNLYLHTVLQMGAIWSIAFCIAFFLVAKKRKDVRVHLCILCWCLYAFVENVGINGLIFMPSLLPALLLTPNPDSQLTQ